VNLPRISLAPNPLQAVIGALLLSASVLQIAYAEPTSVTSVVVPARTPVSVDRITASNYGMSIFIWNNPSTTARDLTTLQAAGVGWQKTLFKWRDMNPNPGVYNFNESDRVVAASNQAHLKIIARIDFQPWWSRSDQTYANARPDNPQWYADFVRVFADRYKAGSVSGHVDAIEVWNEPNLQREWGGTISQQSATEYVHMLQLTYAAVKSVDPSMQVISAGLSPTGFYDGTAAPDDQYLQWMYNAGLSGSYDVLGVNANAQVADPTAAPGSIDGLADGSFYFRRIEQMRAIEEHNGDTRPVWLMEYGWTSDSIHPDRTWYAVSEDQKSASILAAMQYARTNWPWMGVMALWGMPDPTWTPDREEYWWMVTNPDGTDRPAIANLIRAAQANLLPVAGQFPPAVTPLVVGPPAGAHTSVPADTSAPAAVTDDGTLPVTDDPPLAADDGT
jgi:polysaccharide biosynthesis protein PslG